MRSILAIAWKDALVRFSSRTELLFFIILPVIFTFIIGGGFGGNTNADARVRLLLVDEAHTAPAKQLIEALSKSSTVWVDELPRAVADAEFAANRAPALLTIPPGFDTATLAAGVELALQTQPNSLGAPVAERAVSAADNVVSTAVTGARQSVAEAERIQLFASASARQAYFDHALAEAQKLLNATPDRMEVTFPATTPYRYNAAAQSSAGQLVTWVFIPLLSISALLAYERRQGTLRRLFTMPVTKAQLLLGTLSGQVVTALVQMILLVGFGIP
jgi:ABC-2 type transport system permease protein